MMMLFAGFICTILILVNLGSMAIAARRWRIKSCPPLLDRPPVSIVRPLCGVESFSFETLASSFCLNWPIYELIFCVQNQNDPIIPMVRRAMAAHPHSSAQLLIGDDVISHNPKLNNCVKGWRAARYNWIALTDSNVLMPPDYLERFFRVVKPDSGLLISMPYGTRADGFFAEIESVMLNSYQARWQYAAEACGMGFAQGKNMLWPRSVLEEAGGIEILAAEPAEDAASTKLMRALGRKIHLVDFPFEQPIGRRSLREVWERHARWAQLRRATFPFHFIWEIFTGSLPPMLFAALLAPALGYSPWAGVLIVAATLYGAELVLMKTAGMAINWKTLPAFVARDASLPSIWAYGLFANDFTWRGQKVNMKEVKTADPPYTNGHNI